MNVTERVQEMVERSQDAEEIRNKNKEISGMTLGRECLGCKI